MQEKVMLSIKSCLRHAEMATDLIEKLFLIALVQKFIHPISLLLLAILVFYVWQELFTQRKMQFATCNLVLFYHAKILYNCSNLGCYVVYLFRRIAHHGIVLVTYHKFFFLTDCNSSEWNNHQEHNRLNWPNKNFDSCCRCFTI